MLTSPFKPFKPISAGFAPDAAQPHAPDFADTEQATLLPEEEAERSEWAETEQLGL